MDLPDHFGCCTIARLINDQMNRTRVDCNSQLKEGHYNMSKCVGYFMDFKFCGKCFVYGWKDGWMDGWIGWVDGMAQKCVVSSEQSSRIICLQMLIGLIFVASSMLFQTRKIFFCLQNTN